MSETMTRPAVEAPGLKAGDPVGKLDQLRALPAGSVIVYAPTRPDIRKRYTRNTHSEGDNKAFSPETGGTALALSAFAPSIRTGQLTVESLPAPEPAAERMFTRAQVQDRIDEALDEFKREAGRVAMRYAKANNWCGEVTRCLNELGIEPPVRRISGRITVTYRFDDVEVTTDCDDITADFIRQSFYTGPQDLELDSDFDHARIPVDAIEIDFDEVED